MEEQKYVGQANVMSEEGDGDPRGISRLLRISSLVRRYFLRR